MDDYANNAEFKAMLEKEVRFRVRQLHEAKDREGLLDIAIFLTHLSAFVSCCFVGQNDAGLQRIREIMTAEFAKATAHIDGQIRAEADRMMTERSRGMPCVPSTRN